jgi:AI-2 transport protein TqsA
VTTAIQPAGSGSGGDGPPPSTAARRSEIPRALAILLGSAAAVITLAGVRAAAWLIGPLFLALVIVVALSPVKRWLEDHGWPSWASMLALVAAVYALILSFVMVGYVSMAQLATELPKYAGAAQSLVAGVTDTLERLGVEAQQAQTTASSVDLTKLASVIGSLLSGLTDTLTSLVFLLALLLFLTLETSSAGERIAEIAADRKDVADALGRFATGTRVYLIVTTVFGLIVAVLDTVALALLGIPLAITWGMLAFITNYIPNVGFILGLVPPAVLALLVGGWPLFVWVIVIYCVLNFVIQELIQPRFVGDSVGLSATVTLLSLVFWAWIVGALGALLAIPLTLLVKGFLVDIDPRARWANALLRSQTPDKPPPKERRARVPRRAKPAPATEEG